MQEPAVKEPEWVEGSSGSTEDESDGDISSADTVPLSIPSKFLLSESSTSLDEIPPVGVDAETQARLEALLNVTGLSQFSLESQQFNDPEVLRRLTTSVSSALDEAAAALTRMKAEPNQANHPTQNCPSALHTLRSQTAQIAGTQQLPPPPTQQLPQQLQQPPPTVQPESNNLRSTHAVPPSPSRSLVDACMEGDISTVKRLLDMGRDVNQITEEGESLLSLACASGYYELAQLLLVMRANIEERGLKDTTPLMEAANAGYCKIVKLLLAHGADVNAKTQQGNTALMFACSNGFEDVVQVLLEAGANAEAHNESGHTPLMEAASAGQVGVARLLVKHGAQINSHSNEFKESALTLACYKGHLEMVRFLLEAGADREHKTDEMHTALMEASMDGHVDVARLLLDSGAQVNMPQDSFESPLTLAACGGHVELAQLLLDRGASIEEVNDEGYTPLMEGAREGHEDMVALLLSQGADINAQTEETQETALTLACCGGFLEVTDFLIKAGADLELGASTPLMEAAQEGQVDLVRYLIGAGANVNACTATGDTALTYSCENGHTDVADLLLQAGAALEHESEGGRTPLMKASRAGNVCTVKFLLTKGACPNKKTTTNDHTPLSLACAGGHTQVVKMLLDAGANIAHRLKDNSSMLIEAAKGGHVDTVHLLLEYQKEVDEIEVHATALHSGAPNEKGCIHMILERKDQNQGSTTAPPQPQQPQGNDAVEFRSDFDCLTSMLKTPIPPLNAPALSEEQKIRSKHHILEELHKVERELQEQVQKTCSKTNAQGFLTSLVSDVVTGTANIVSQDVEPSTSTAGLMVAPPPHALEEVDTSIALPVVPEAPLLDIEWQTDSNHDTALTLACTGGHRDLVVLLLEKKANIEHRDKKGFTPLMLAATVGHSAVVEALLSHSAQMEAQSERTKDTALSLACSGGRLEVVEFLLDNGANREHRNVSDYTPLSLAASGGYGNIIRLLLHHGAEINSRTGSKLGISPLMLAAMNGHTAAVRLLLDQGSDINAQIETNRNTALTLACFQGRHEVVSLLLDRKANVEHRAKTGLTPLMEAASGGYVEVGKVLLDKGADVNAPPVPSSRDTALTIAADKGHLRFVELLLERYAAVDVRNKKGNSPLWLACNGGHLDVVQKLVNAKADIDSQDNRKVSCLMAAFRQGHQKVVKWMVKHVTQFPSDQEMTRYIQTLSDKELLKKCQVCMDIIHQAKERQLLEANRNASSLLKSLEEEKTREEQKKAAAARRREKKRLKKKAKQANSKDDDRDDELELYLPTETRPPTIDEISNAGGSPTCIVPQRRSNHGSPTPPKSPSPTPLIRVEKSPPSSPTPTPPPPPVQNILTSPINLPTSSLAARKERKKNERNRQIEPVCTQPSNYSVALGAVLAMKNLRLGEPNGGTKEQEQPFEAVTSSRQRNKFASKVIPTGITHGVREEGWKEVTRKTKKVTVPASAIARVIGRAGCNINAIREVSGAHIEVEKQNPKATQGERIVLIRGSGDSTKHAQNLIAGLADDADAELSDVIQKCGLSAIAAKNRTVQILLKTAAAAKLSPNSGILTSQLSTKPKLPSVPLVVPLPSAWGQVFKAPTPQTPVVPTTSVSDHKLKKNQETLSSVVGATKIISSTPQTPTVRNKASSPLPATVTVVSQTPVHPEPNTQTSGAIRSTSPQAMCTRWQQNWSSEQKNWTNGPSANNGGSASMQERPFSSVVASSQVPDSPSPTPRAVSSSCSISPRSEDDSLSKSGSFSRSANSLNHPSSVHASPTNFRQVANVTGNTMSAPCTPPFSSASGHSSPTPAVQLLDYSNLSACNSSSSNNNNQAHGGCLKGNLMNNSLGGTATSISPPASSSGSLPIMSGVNTSVNGQTHGMPSLMDMNEQPAPIIPSQHPPPVGAGSGYKYGAPVASHMDMSGALVGNMGSMYSNNNNNYHHHTLNNLASQMVYHHEVNGVSNHSQLQHQQVQQAMNGLSSSGMAGHLERQLQPLPIGTERAQQRKTSTMPSNHLWKLPTVGGGMPNMTDVERNWYQPGYDQMNTVGDYSMRSMSNVHSNPLMAGDNPMNQIPATPGLPQPDMSYHQMGIHGGGIASSSDLSNLIPSPYNGIGRQSGFMFGGGYSWNGQPNAHSAYQQPPPTHVPHKTALPKYISNSWTWKDQL